MAYGDDGQRGFDALRLAVARILTLEFPGPFGPQLGLAGAGIFAVPPRARSIASRPTPLWSEAVSGWAPTALSSVPDPVGPESPDGPLTATLGLAGDGPDDDIHSDREYRASSEADLAQAQRLIALVELARGGDSEAFGLLYDHYQTSVYRFLYYRLGSTQLAEDLTSETFFRALRSMSSFRWQGKDFGAWLMTIARNLTTDHFKSGRTRLETTTEDMSPHDSHTESPETMVLASLTNEALVEALRQLPSEQQECLIMRFLQGLSIAETAEILGRSEGAIKQLQLRGVRNLAKLMPKDLV